MSIKKLDHVSLFINNPDPVLEFYRDILGFSLASKREIESMNMVVYDLRNNGDYVEIIQQMHGDSKHGDGIKHIAFLSDNIEEDFEEFINKGVHMLHNDVQVFGNASFFFVKSPGGELIEIIQYKD
jgi:catechol 2,3-dioxygenase-like lactoylglutathione lyase family enzyme